MPVNVLMLGSSLSKGCDFQALPMRTGLVLALTKMLLQPASVAGLIFIAPRRIASHVQLKVSRLAPGPAIASKWLVALGVSLTPTTNNILVQVEVGGQDKAAMSTLIFIQYLLWPGRSRLTCRLRHIHKTYTPGLALYV